MKITVLCENTSYGNDYIAEHGLSLFVETAREKFLFDMGQTDVFAHNAQLKGIALEDAEFAVVSHGHYDHTGGLKTFLHINRNAPVYISQHAFGQFYNTDNKFIGADPQLKFNKQLVYTSNVTVINDHITLLSCNSLDQPVPFSPFGLTVKNGNSLLDDPFMHEQYLLLRDRGKRILISGCSHKGVLNLMKWFQPDILIGGFHTMKIDPKTDEGQQYLTGLANQLLRYPAIYYTGHCTGQEQFDFLKSIMHDALQPIRCGETITINE